MAGLDSCVDVRARVFSQSVTGVRVCVCVPPSSLINPLPYPPPYPHTLSKVSTLMCCTPTRRHSQAYGDTRALGLA